MAPIGWSAVTRPWSSRLHAKSLLSLQRHADRRCGMEKPVIALPPPY
jgi:hypothetical protein